MENRSGKTWSERLLHLAAAGGRIEKTQGVLSCDVSEAIEDLYT